MEQNGVVYSPTLERIQNQGEMLRQGTLEKPFGGIVDCARWINTNEGFAAFWRSNTTNCIRYFPTQAFNLSFKDTFKKMFPSTARRQTSECSLP